MSDEVLVVTEYGMSLMAIKQATERAEREGIPCFVYKKGRTWFVRTAEEGAPDGAEFIHSTVE